MSEPAAVYEMDIERDRKTCVALDLKVSGANRELAQWLVDHPRYSGKMIADWLGCGARRINYLRAWAGDGFSGGPYDAQKPAQPSLKTQDNSTSDADEESEEEDEPRQLRLPTKRITAEANAGWRAVFLHCAADCIRKAEQGAGLEYVKGSDIDDEVLSTLSSVVKAWTRLLDEMQQRREDNG